MEAVVEAEAVYGDWRTGGGNRSGMGNKQLRQKAEAKQLAAAAEAVDVVAISQVELAV